MSFKKSPGHKAKLPLVSSSVANASVPAEQRLQQHLTEQLVNTRLQLQLAQSQLQLLERSRDEQLRQLQLLESALRQRQRLLDDSTETEVCRQLHQLRGQLQLAASELSAVINHVLDSVVTPDQTSWSLRQLFEYLQSRPLHRPPQQLPAGAAAAAHLQLLQQLRLVQLAGRERVAPIDTRPDLEPFELLQLVIQRCVTSATPASSSSCDTSGSDEYDNIG